MATRIQVSPDLAEKVAAFADTGGLELEIVESGPADLRVNVSGERRESTVDVLEAGGWIKCATAWALARRHGVELLALGGLLNVLDIKIRECCLGCFR